VGYDARCAAERLKGCFVAATTHQHVVGGIFRILLMVAQEWAKHASSSFC